MAIRQVERTLSGEQKRLLVLTTPFALRRQQSAACVWGISQDRRSILFPQILLVSFLDFIFEGACKLTQRVWEIERWCINNILSTHIPPNLVCSLGISNECNCVISFFVRKQEQSRARMFLSQLCFRSHLFHLFHFYVAGRNGKCYPSWNFCLFWTRTAYSKILTKEEPCDQTSQLE